MTKTRILLVDDHAVVRLGLKTLINDQPALEVVGEASSAAEAIEAVARLRPEVVLMDIRMPGESGLEATRQITQQFPGTRVVMLTSYADDDLLIRAIRAGATGYVLKQADNDALLLALVRTRYSAGNTLVEVDPETGQQSITPEAQAEYTEATDAWFRYLRTSPEQPNPNVAQQAANVLFTLASIATTTAEAEANLTDAAKAQAIVAKARPSVGTLSTLAYYSYAALDFKQGDKATKQAVASASSKAEARSVERQLASIRKQAKKFQQQQQQAAAKGGQQQAEQQLENPLGGLSGGGLGAPTTP